MESRFLRSCLALCITFAILTSFVPVHCEAANAERGRHGRALFQAAASSSASARATTSTGSSLSTSTSVSDGCNREQFSVIVVADGAALVDANGSPRVTQVPFSENDLVCLRCPEESQCELCCCGSGECVDPAEAAAGTQNCYILEVAAASPVTANECAHCQHDDCNMFHWCR